MSNLTLQQITDYLSAVVTDMNNNNQHKLALEAQTALAAVNMLQSACAENGFTDSSEDAAGDWPIKKREGLNETPKVVSPTPYLSIEERVEALENILAKQRNLNETRKGGY